MRLGTLQADNMQVYAVGGAVRDKLLGLPVKDRDFVVVGATPEMMVAQGYLPVGKDFPVFLHPRTREEYALARTERKTAPGYKGFVIHADPDVSLEQDLARRDFTVNAIAQADDGSLIDPYQGQLDLASRVFRHVSAAFSEDPVRILRAARFMARFEDFSIAPETMQLMRDMVAAGEVDALVPERVWQELARGLMEVHPSRMFMTLRECGALVRILPEVEALFGVTQPEQHHPEIDTGVHVMMVVDYAASMNFELPVRFAALMHDLGKGITPRELWPKHHGHEGSGVALVKAICVRLRVPKECADLAVLATRYHGDIHRAQQLRADTIVKLFGAVDAYRRPERFVQLLQACLADARGRLGFEKVDYPQMDYLLAALQVATNIDTAGIVENTTNPAKIGECIIAARAAALTEWINK
ncbi:multifunctional CCA protein [Sulfuriferula nivalis]|uniref:Multifunctional CCA protein n=2 Tax=Sulfuriferula nivalis TaxID=2675298 RepID=A0A809S7K3_9PROT|nr:multifunctional CCA protein [Sulfuriferula nivalis]